MAVPPGTGPPGPGTNNRSGAAGHLRLQWHTMVVDNDTMLSRTDWQPVVASHTVHAGANIVAARVLGQELAVWRGAGGLVQVWLDRCPHRGVRLSLGRITGDRLACAYHGWEFAAHSGQCMAIPALADLASPPGNVRAATFTAQEAQGMVWARLQSSANAAPAPVGVNLRADVVSGIFLRSIAIRSSVAQLGRTLHGYGMAAEGATVWLGLLAAHPVRLFVTCAQDDLVILHVWLEHAAPATPPAPLFAALRRLRSEAEAATS